MAAPVRSTKSLVATDAFGGVLVDSGEYTAAADLRFDKYGEASGVVVVIKWTAETDAGASIAYTLQGYDPVGDVVWDLATVTLTDVGTTGKASGTIQVHPALHVTEPTADADGLPILAVAGAGNAIVPPHLNLKVTPADTKRVSYSVGVYFTS